MQRLALTPAPPDSVSFRLSKEVAAALAAKAARAGVSPNLLARDLMTAALLEPPDEQRRSLELILAELGRIRTALSAANGPRGSEELSSRLLAEFHKILSTYFNRLSKTPCKTSIHSVPSLRKFFAIFRNSIDFMTS